MGIGQRLANGLPAVCRFITKYNDKGTAEFAGNRDETINWHDVGGIKNYALGYTTTTSPVNIADDADISTFDQHLVRKPGMVIPGGAICRYVDFAPGVTSPMHRTISVDFGVVIEGQMESKLDSGETRLMNRGDLMVMRAALHEWRNPSKTEWARMLFVLLDAEAPIVNGKTVDEDYRNALPGIPKSQ
ncbi:hypothetical protein LTR37_001733 [Vermiconidia calcicola]|uniref:Uncharacterized protein n=1 Tax=Vermiconidia calcicola TaxID=1690605 RepID=A0ACC3NUL0_9PEZI|nr:hypothetical protein LTR37_001733 [Vermiconidia calcicola]